MAPRTRSRTAASRTCQTAGTPPANVLNVTGTPILLPLLVLLLALCAFVAFLPSADRPESAQPRYVSPASSAQRLSNQDASIYTKICGTERVLSEFYPSVIPPPTMFALLNLDPYQPPFHPASQSAVRGGALADDAHDAILDAWAKASKEYKRSGGGPRDEKHAILVNMAAEVLLDVDHRRVYMTRFIMSKAHADAISETGRPAANAGRGAVPFADRRRDLERECRGFWKRPF